MLNFQVELRRARLQESASRYVPSIAQCIEVDEKEVKFLDIELADKVLSKNQELNDHFSNSALGIEKMLLPVGSSNLLEFLLRFMAISCNEDIIYLIVDHERLVLEAPLRPLLKNSLRLLYRHELPINLFALDERLSCYIDFAFQDYVLDCEQALELSMCGDKFGDYIYSNFYLFS